MEKLLNNQTKKLYKKHKSGITLIALVITIIVLLILAGVSINMLLGDNTIINKATEAKTKMGTESQKEEIQLEVLGSYETNGEINVEKLKTNLQAKGYTVTGNSLPLTVTANGQEYPIDENGNVETLGKTIGENYRDSWIGRTIDYKSEANNVNDWIIFGKQTNEQGKNDIIITTKNPVGSLEIGYTLADWTEYETTINTACKTYVGETGTLGTKTATIKDVRSIILEDINAAVGFNETINPVTISNSNGGYAYPNSDGTGWIKNTDENYSSYTFPTEEYLYGTLSIFKSVSNNYSNVPMTLGKPENMDYVLANKTSYSVGTRMVGVDPYIASFRVAGISKNGVSVLGLCVSTVSDGIDVGGNKYSSKIRPVVILSSEISWSDVEGLIGNYATY